ncbi:MAG TPA: hypothetical protein VGB08_08740 [Allosphingosinicella sp.]|jgi:hypothetical protein
MKLGTLAAATALAAGGAALPLIDAASAQPRQAPQAGQAPAAAQPAQRQFNLSAAERTALAPLIAAHSAAVAAAAAGQAPDWAAVEALLPAAQAAAHGADARYLVARVQLALGTNRNNTALQAAALDVLVASPSSLPDELPRYLNARAEIAFAAQDFAAAERIYQRLLELTPGDQRVVGNLAVVRRRMGNSAGALDAILQNVSAQESAGGRAEEALYRRARDIAYTARDRRAAELATRLARHYPTAANWRDAVNIYREIFRPNAALALDTMRLMRAAGALSSGNDYLAFAQVLDQAGLPGETKAVLDEAVARRAVAASDAAAAQMLRTATRRIAEDRAGLTGQIAQARGAPTGRLARAVGDALYGYGRYGEAAELYRTAMSKTGEDRNLLNLRLGAALAMAGQRGEAEAAFGAVAGEPAELAKLWLAWLSRQGA